MAQPRKKFLPSSALILGLGLSLGLGINLNFSLQPALADYQNPAFDKGRAKMAAGDFDGAVNSFGEEIGMNDTDARGYLMRGQCFYKLQNYKLAIQDMDKALQLAPNNVRALLVRGSCKANLGQDDEAVADYVAAIKLEPNLGTRYFKNGGPSIEARTNNGDAGTTGNGGKRRRRGRVVNENGQATIEAVQKSDKHTDEYADGHADLRLHAIEDYKKAMNIVYPRGLEVAASGAAAVPGAGEFEGDARKALADLNEVIRNDPNNPVSYYKRAKALQKLGRADDALKDYDQAIQRDPQKSQYYIGRASVFFQLDKPLLCEAEIARARAVDPDVPAAVRFELPKYDDNVKRSANSN